MKAGKIVCVGNLVHDEVFQVESLPSSGTKIGALAYQQRYGGSAATAAVAICRLGGAAAYWGRVGSDAAGHGAIHLMRELGVDCSGVSVLPEHRGYGVGRALFARAAEHARNRFVPRLFMHCLAENAAIMHIARTSGMDIVAEQGDADAYLALSPASPASVTGEYLIDRLALFDYALKAQIAALKGINSALEGV